MKYILIKLDVATQAEQSRTEYFSLCQMSKDLCTTYCSCYNNFLLNETTTQRQPKKLSQLKFNRQYKIICG